MIYAGKGLASKGHQVTIACLQKSIIEENSKKIGLNTWKFHIPLDLAFWKMSTLKKFLKRSKTDVLICCQNKDVKIGARAARQTGIKAIFARQGVQNLTNKRKYIVPFTRFIDGIITNTQSIKITYESFGWFPDNFIHVIYNGVKIPEFVDTLNIHKRFDISESSKVIFSAGRLDHQKGFDLLIEVAKMAKKKGLNWFFLIAGEGKIKSELNALADQKGVHEIVKFIGFSNEIPSLLKACDVFVLPSRYEGMPNALLEAMAMGKASIATNVNGAPELLEDGKSGFLVDSEKPTQIFERLMELLVNDVLRKSMENQALERVKHNFTFEKMTDNLEALLEKQISRSKTTNALSNNRA